MNNIDRQRTPGHLRVFLCHSSGDKPTVRELYDRLTDAGFEPWLDERNLLPGQDWRYEITKAVRNSDVVIVCLSKGSVSKAGFIQSEIKFALDVADEQPEGTIFIIPLKLEECEVPTRLNRWHWVNNFEAQGKANLLRALKARAGQIKDASGLSKRDELNQKITPLLRAKYVIVILFLLASGSITWFISQNDTGQKDPGAVPSGTEVTGQTPVSPTPQLQNLTPPKEVPSFSPTPTQNLSSATEPSPRSSSRPEMVVKRQLPSPSPTGPSSTGKRGVSFLEIVNLVKNFVSDDRIIAVISKYGISFKPTDKALTQLRNLGASEAVISAVKEANVAQ